MRGVYGVGGIELRQGVAEPEAGPGEVVLKVRAVGICDTDLHLAAGYMGYRGILGHEFVGETEDGRRWTAEINCSCHACPTCAAGRPNHCPNRTVVGILGRDGAMADRVRVPERNLHPLPDSVPDRAAVFVEPLAAAFRVAEEVPLGGEGVAVLGDGKLGLLCARVAAAEGGRVTLVGKHPEKLAKAGGPIRTVLLDESGGGGRDFDVVIDATGAPSGLATALGLVRPGGTVVLKTTMARPYEIDLAPIVIDEVRLIGSRCGPFPRAIEALAGGGIGVEDLIEEELPLDRAREGFDRAARRGALKVILRP